MKTMKKKRKKKKKRSVEEEEAEEDDEKEKEGSKLQFGRHKLMRSWMGEDRRKEKLFRTGQYKRGIERKATRVYTTCSLCDRSTLVILTVAL